MSPFSKSFTARLWAADIWGNFGRAATAAGAARRARCGERLGAGVRVMLRELLAVFFLLARKLDALERPEGAARDGRFFDAAVFFLTVAFNWVISVFQKLKDL